MVTFISSLFVVQSFDFNADKSSGGYFLYPHIEKVLESWDTLTLRRVTPWVIFLRHSLGHFLGHFLA